MQEGVVWVKRKVRKGLINFQENLLWYRILDLREKE
jgi:hypothetical protein